jgi:hypothetical protein
MSLFLATLLPGLFLAALGAALLANQPAVVVALKLLPRSPTAALFFFGGGALWFLWLVWHLSAADFGEYHVLLTIGFAAVAGLAFKCVPDFLAVRGLCVLVLLGAAPLLNAAYMEYDKPWRLLMVTPVYLLIAAAIWLGVQPYRLRDFFDWLFLRPGRARGLGGALLAYGLLLVAVACTC